MTPATDLALESLHATANGIFTGALKACNIASPLTGAFALKATNSPG